jgi:tetratricopeptide (TPR) repeat protein
VCWSIGDGARAQRVCLRAAELAQRLGNPERLARAALGFAGPSRITFARAVSQTGPELLERAIDSLGEAETPLRARTMARLVLSLRHVPAHRERKRSLAGQALEMARRIGEPAALSEALAAYHEATWRPDNVAERLAITRELARSAGELGDGALAATAHARIASALLELADIDGSRRELEHLERLAETLQQSYPRWFLAVSRASHAYLEGRLDDCDSFIHAAAAVARGWYEETAAGTLAAQLSYLRYEQGRLEDALDAVDRMAEHFAEIPATGARLALLYAQCGRHAAAREQLERFAQSGFADLPRDALWLAGVRGLGEVAALLGDVRCADQLYPMLLPHAELCSVVTFLHCAGSAARPLGLLATTLSRFDDAARHFETALATNARLRSPLWIAHTQHDYAQALLRRGEAGDRERALDLLAVALATAETLGLDALAQSARRLEQAEVPTEPRAERAR